MTWVQSVFKGNKQTTVVGNGLIEQSRQWANTAKGKIFFYFFFPQQLLLKWSFLSNCLPCYRLSINQLNSTHLVIELYEIASFFTKFKAWSCSYQSCWGGWVAAGVGDRKSTRRSDWKSFCKKVIRFSILTIGDRDV